MKRVFPAALLTAASAVLIAACGGGGQTTSSPTPKATSTPPATASPTPTPTATASPTVAPTHTAGRGEPALVPVPGYTYANAPASHVADVNEAVAKHPDVFVSASSHDVLRDGTVIGRVDLFKVQHHYEESPRYRALLPGFARDIAKINSWQSVTVTQETIESEQVTVVTGTADGVRRVAYLWFHNDTETDVFGLASAETRDFIDGYLKAEHH